MEQRGHNNEELVLELQRTEKALKASERLRTTALANKSIYEQQLRENEQELKALGTTAEKAEKEVVAIDAEIEKTLKQINEMIPFELLERYNMLK